jgi:hypothetical protein
MYSLLCSRKRSQSPEYVMKAPICAFSSLTHRQAWRFQAPFLLEHPMTTPPSVHSVSLFDAPFGVSAFGQPLPHLVRLSLAMRGYFLIQVEEGSPLFFFFFLVIHFDATRAAFFYSVCFCRFDLTTT